MIPVDGDPPSGHGSDFDAASVRTGPDGRCGMRAALPANAASAGADVAQYDWDLEAQYPDLDTPASYEALIRRFNRMIDATQAELGR